MYYSPIIYERALSFSDIWLAIQLGLTGWKKTVFIVSLTALVTATASAIGYFIRPYVAKAWAVWSAKLAGLMKGAYSSIAKLLRKK